MEGRQPPAARLTDQQRVQLRQLNWSLISAVAFFICLIVSRAWRQDFTIDEADATIAYVLRDNAWSSGSGNHLLNTLLMRVSATLIPWSPFSLRIPALIGGACYLVCSATLCARLVPHKLNQTLCFLVFALNPLTLDFLFPARGYALGLGFEAAALLMMSRDLDAKGLLTVSVMCGLSILANYSFAVGLTCLCGSLLVVQFVHNRDAHATLRNAVLLAGPACAIIVIFCLDQLLHLPRHELWGAGTYWKTIANLDQNMFGSFDENLFPRSIAIVLGFVNQNLGGFLFAVFLLAAVLSLWRLYFLPYLPAVCLLATILAIGVQYCIFVLSVAKLPLSRTALVFIPLLTVAIIIPLFSKTSVWRNAFGALVCGTIALLFLGNFRNDFIADFKYNADAGRAFTAADAYAKAHNLDDLQTTWHYESVALFYRLYLGSPIKEFRPVEDLSCGHQLYLIAPAQAGIVERCGLKVIYRSQISDVAVGAADR